MEKQWNECLSKRHALQWLQLRWLDREWHRLLFWPEQPSLHHNERADYRNGRLFKERNAYTHADAMNV